MAPKVSAESSINFKSYFLANFFIFGQDGTFPIRFGINKAEVLIQNGCTSAVESYIRKIPVVNYLPIKSKNQVFGEFIKSFSLNIYNEKEIFDIIKNKNYKILKKKKNC